MEHAVNSPTVDFGYFEQWIPLIEDQSEGTLIVRNGWPVFIRYENYHPWRHLTKTWRVASKVQAFFTKHFYVISSKEGCDKWRLERLKTKLKWFQVNDKLLGQSDCLAEIARWIQQIDKLLYQFKPPQERGFTVALQTASGLSERLQNDKVFEVQCRNNSFVSFPSGVLKVLPELPQKSILRPQQIVELFRDCISGQSESLHLKPDDAKQVASLAEELGLRLLAEDIWCAICIDRTDRQLLDSLSEKKSSAQREASYFSLLSRSAYRPERLYELKDQWRKVPKDFVLELFVRDALNASEHELAKLFVALYQAAPWKPSVKEVEESLRFEHLTGAEFTNVFVNGAGRQLFDGHDKELLKWLNRFKEQSQAYPRRKARRKLTRPEASPKPRQLRPLQQYLYEDRANRDATVQIGINNSECIEREFLPSDRGEYESVLGKLRKLPDAAVKSFVAHSYGVSEKDGGAEPSLIGLLSRCGVVDAANTVLHAPAAYSEYSDEFIQRWLRVLDVQTAMPRWLVRELISRTEGWNGQEKKVIPHSRVAELFGEHWVPIEGAAFERFLEDYCCAATCNKETLLKAIGARLTFRANPFIAEYLKKRAYITQEQLNDYKIEQSAHALTAVQLVQTTLSTFMNLSFRGSFDEVPTEVFNVDIPGANRSKTRATIELKRVENEVVVMIETERKVKLCWKIEENRRLTYQTSNPSKRSRFRIRQRDFLSSGSLDVGSKFESVPFTLSVID